MSHPTPPFEDALVQALGSTRSAVVLDLLRERDAYIVGGWVRDTLAGRGSDDVDLATPDSDGLSGELVERAGHRRVLMDRTRGTWRVILGSGLTVDVTRPKGEGEPWIEADLRQRDLRINAMAWSPRSGLVDPLGGLQDLRAGRLQLVAPGALRADPLRGLRLWRFAVSWGAAPSPEARAEASSLRLDGVADERIQAELRRILAHPGAELGVLGLAGDGLLAQALPGAPDADRWARIRGDDWRLEALQRCRQQCALEEPDEIALHLGWLCDATADELVTRRWPTRTARRAEAVVAGRRAGAGAVVPAKLADELVGWGVMAPWFLVGRAATGCAAARPAITCALEMLDAASSAAERRAQGVTPLPRPLLDGAQLVSALGRASGPWVSAALAALVRDQLTGRIRDPAGALATARRVAGVG